MPLTVEWGIENRILLTKGSGTVTVEELRAGQNRADTLLETAPLNVHDILNFLEVEQHPTLLQLMEFRAFFLHPKLGWLIIVSQDKIITFFSALIAGINNNRVRAFPTLDAALRFLAEYDQTLPNPLTPHMLPSTE